jgi:cysteine desulfurase
MIHPGLADGPIYLDYNATTPVDPRMVAALPYLTHHFGQPHPRPRHQPVRSPAARPPADQHVLESRSRRADWDPCGAHPGGPRDAISRCALLAARHLQ